MRECPGCGEPMNTKDECQQCSHCKACCLCVKDDEGEEF